MRVVSHWNRLHRELVDAQSLEVFEAEWGCEPPGLAGVLPMAGVLEFKVPSRTNHPVIEVGELQEAF